MPGLDPGHLGDGEAKQALHHREHPRQDPGHGEVGAQFLLADLVAVLAELLRIVGDIPGLQGIDTVQVPGIVGQFREFPAGPLHGPQGQIVEEGQDLGRVLRHLGRQGAFGEVGEAEQLGQLMPQCQDLLHQVGVVPAPGIRALVRGAGTVGRVDLLAQGPVVGVGHHRHVGGEVQGEEPAGLAPLRSGLARQGLGGVRQAGEAGLVVDALAPGIGGVEQVLRVLAGQFGQGLVDVLVAGLAVRRQVDAGEVEVTQGIGEQLALGRVQVLLGRHRLVAAEQVGVLTDLGAVGAELGQTGVVGGAQGVAVHDAVEVPHRGPDAAEAVVLLLQGLDEPLPGGHLVAAGEGGDAGTALRQGGIHRRLDVFGEDLGEGRQAAHLQEGIGHGRLRMGLGAWPGFGSGSESGL